MARRYGGGARGRPAAIFLFCLKMSVNPGPQAFRVAWVNIQGVRRVCGILIMFSVLFASYALAPFFVLREFIFSKKSHRSLFDLLVDVFAYCVPFFRDCVLIVGCDV